MTMPDGTSFDTDLVVTFEEEAPGRTRLTILQTGFPTRLTILQTGFPTTRLRDEIAGGWPSILDGLGRVVAARAAGPHRP
jgi:hypothetical protein